MRALLKTNFLILFVLAFLVISCKDILQNGPTDLTNISDDLTPAVSPDGFLIAYYHMDSHSPELKDYPTGLYLMNFNGTGRKLLLKGEHTGPSWSPDSKWLVFKSGGTLQIINRDADSTRIFDGINGITLFSPDWSKDGKSILFSSPDSNGGIFTCDPFFKKIHLLLSKQQVSGFDPKWSSSGKELVYSKTYSNLEIYIIETTGNNEIQLTNNARTNLNPAWSPDGSMIAWSSNSQIYIMNINGTDPHKLDNGDYPAWMPDSRYIIYCKGNDEQSNYKTLLWKININGTDKTQLTF